MLIFVFLVAVLNLGVGYALGRGLTLGDLLELLPKRKAKPDTDDLEDDLELTQTVEEEAEEDAAPQPTPEDMMASLASFRDKLNATSIELKLKKEDSEKFEETANKLQKANHEYLEEAEGAIEHLGQLGAEGDAIAEATSNAIAEGTEQVAKMSGEIDGFIDAGLKDEEVRSQLISKAAEMRDAATELQESTSTAIAEAESEAVKADSDAKPEESPTEQKEESPASEEPKERATARTLDSVEELLTCLEKTLEGAEEGQIEHLAAIRIDPVEGHEEDEACRKSVAAAVEGMALNSLGEGHAYVQGEPAMMFLQGASYEDALQRIEGLRQLVASTTYSYNDTQVKATITCAIADAKTGDARDQVIEQLDQALQESQTGGGNQTYHHDGAFPTAVSA